MLLRATTAVLLSWMAGSLAIGQSTRGAVAGIVQDSSGAPVAGAIVCLKTAGTNGSRETATDSTGNFVIPDVAPDSYELSVSKSGFRSLHQADLKVPAGATASLQLQLEVGPVAETLDVSDNPGAIDVSGKALGELFSALEVLDLVHDDLIITDLAYLRSGVARRASGGLGSGYVVGGARADNTNFILDGFGDYDPRTGSAQVMPNYDAILEFRAQTSGNTAEYGRLAGGVMNMVLRTGGNRVHGSFFEFYRSSDLAARNFFDTVKPDLLRHQFGATVSGPVTLPKLYRGSGRTFFLASFEGLRQSYGSTRISNVPTALEHGGDFSASLDAAGRPVAVVDPLNGKPFAGNRIPANRLDPIGQRIISYYPSPNRGDPFSNYQTNAANQARWNSLLLKFDEHPTDKSVVSLRYLSRMNAYEYPYTGSELGAFGSRARNRPVLAGLNTSYTFSPSLVNEFRAGIIRTADHETGQYAGVDMNSVLGLPGAPGTSRLYGFPRFSVLNLATIGDAVNMPFDFTLNNYELADAISWTRGRHLFKAGIDFLRTQFFQQLYFNTRGSYSFLGRWTSAPAADLLLGLPDSVSRQSTSGAAYLFSTDWGLFLQDQISVSSKLTINYGVRYEMMLPPYEKYGRLSSFVPELGKVVIADSRTIPDLSQRLAAAGLAGFVTTATQAGLPRSLVYANRRDFAPRLAFAYRPVSRTILRGAYGIYFGNSLLDPIRNDLTNIYPFTISQTFNRVAAKPTALTLEDPFPAALASLPGVTNVNGFQLHPGAQYLQSYTFSVERELNSTTTLEVDYAGSRGTHLGQRYDLNQPFRDPAFKLPNGSFPRPYAGFGAINYYGFGANSFYSEGSLTLRRSYSHGLFYGLTYTYSKSLDDASQVAGNSIGDYPGAQNSRNLAAERGRSDWDTGHSFLLFGSYALPFRRGALLRGWQLSTITRLYTGQPFTPRVANANLNLGEANRPNRIGAGVLSVRSVAEWFDIPAFPVVARGAFGFGNSGRNILDGPGSVYVNVALMKNFRMPDRARAQIRCEAINVLNHPNFGLPVDYVDVSNAGQILSADSGRALQFGLRVWF